MTNGRNFLKKLHAAVNELEAEGYSTWEEMTPRLNKMFNASYGESTYRKRYKDYKRGLEDSITEEDLMYKLQNIRRKQKQLGIERSINNEQIRDLAIRDVITEQFGDAIRNVQPIKIESKPKAQPRNKQKGHVLFLADLHYNGDDDLFDLESLFSDVVYKVEKFVKENDVRQLTVVELGDVIEGSAARQSQLRVIKKGAIPQMVDVIYHYANFLAELRRVIGIQIDFHTVTSSNHTETRPVGTSAGELMDEDLMIMFAEMLKVILEDVNGLTVNSDETFVIEPVEGVRVFCAHGHRGNVSPNNIKNQVYKHDFYKDVKADHYVFGHYHHYEAIDLNYVGQRNKRAFLVPQLGAVSNDYEERNLLGSRSGFVIMEFDTEIGHRYTITY